MTIIIKPFILRSHKVPGPAQYESREITSSLSLEVPSDATPEEVQDAIKRGADLMERVDREVVKPDLEKKETTIDVPIVDQQLITRGILAGLLRTSKSVTELHQYKTKLPNYGFSKVEELWWVKVLDKQIKSMEEKSGTGN